MRGIDAEPARIGAAWQGRVSGCLLGKALEVLSFEQGLDGVRDYLDRADSLPLRDYVPLLEGTVVARRAAKNCRGRFERAEPDDDINYTMLALLLLESRGADMDTADVARAWLRHLPAGETWTAERAAYRVLLERMDDEFVNGTDPGFDLAACADNPCNEWIGAQIRADLYGWVYPGQPRLAAELAGRDAALSHRGDGVNGAMFIAALGAAIPASRDLGDAIRVALEEIPGDSGAANAVRLGCDVANQPDAVETIHARYASLSPVHTLNNLALVVWSLCSADGDFSQAVGDVVAAGLDTDCNGATVGGLVGLSGAEIPAWWTRPWGGRIGLSLAGYSEVRLDEVVARTVAVAQRLKQAD